MTNFRKSESHSRLPASSFAVLLLGGCCLGVAPVVVKAIDLSPEASAFYRVALSAPIFAAGTIFIARNVARSTETVHWLSTRMLYLLTAFIFAADLVLMHMAIRLSDVAVATLLTNFAPFFVGILGLIGLTSRPDVNFWFMLPIALAGCALLIGSPQSTDTQIIGSILALSAAFCYACYVVGVTELRKRGRSTISIMTVVTVVSTIFLLPLFASQGFPIPTTFETVALLFVLVLIGQILGQGLTTIALKELPASLSSLVLLVQPIIAGCLSWYFLSEALSAVQLIGMSMVLLAIAGAAFLPKHLFRKN
ncbi:hypothetical protein LCGC14_0043620 [marine sediment metagenome]|uniref:EamA family transporter n=2 Tax=root TaxID=1 RepID=A0A7V1FPD6_9RHOB|nr:DMT family transporter [Sulfitobacter litoralis]HDZ53417.1 EamA family transporter [Sulfitobacter litoralis]